MSAHPHHHHHADGDGDTEFDWEAMGDHLERQGQLHLGYLREAAAWLRELGAGPVGRVLDVGSGPGVAGEVFAGEFAGAEVVAVDATPGLLERARARGLGTLVAELPGGLAGAGAADLVWASRVVHHLGDQQGALRELAALVRPGGLLAIGEGGLPARFLPRDIGIGRPGFQARLDAVNEEWFEEMRAELPGAVSTVEDWPALLASAGLTPVGSRTFLTELPAPLEPMAREYLHAVLARARETLADRLGADDLRTLDALLHPQGPTSIYRRPDAFYVTATTVHAARALG